MADDAKQGIIEASGNVKGTKSQDRDKVVLGITHSAYQHSYQHSSITKRNSKRETRYQTLLDRLVQHLLSVLDGSAL